MESMRALSRTVDRCHEVQNCSDTTLMKAVPAVTVVRHTCARGSCTSQRTNMRHETSATGDLLSRQPTSKHCTSPHLTNTSPIYHLAAYDCCTASRNSSWMSCEILMGFQPH